MRLLKTPYYYTRRILKSLLPKSLTDKLPRKISTSISDNLAYPHICIQASINFSVFNTFRRNPVYNEILEHVSEYEGLQYLQLISEDISLLEAIDSFRPNDHFGSPRMYDYPTIGSFSPTTLRYIKVLRDLKHHFCNLDNLKIAEIGVGYGGQCRVINAYSKPHDYFLIDIQPALALAQRFLDNYILHSRINYFTMNQLAKDNYDLVISNYAFTELPRKIQDVYLDKVILNSQMGFITYNDISPPEFLSYKSDELVSIIPGARIMKEEPLTHPSNCIIVWNNSNLN
jgi:hypothetical protein